MFKWSFSKKKKKNEVSNQIDLLDVEKRRSISCIPSAGEWTSGTCARFIFNLINYL